MKGGTLITFKECLMKIHVKFISKKRKRTTKKI